MKIRTVSVFRTCLFGALLGLGAPAGYLIYSYLLLNTEQPDFFSWCDFVFQNQMELLFYMTVPTMLVFALFGYYHGKQENELATKTEQMDQFLHIAAHDIRSPITVIKGGIQQMQEGMHGALAPQQQEYLKMVSRQTEVMLELITELLDIYKMESGKFLLEKQSIAVVPLVQKAIDEMKLFAKEKKVTIDLEVAVDLQRSLYADPFRIRQMLRNLLSNGVKHVPDKGKIKMRVGVGKDKRLLLSLWNNGPHIPEDKIRSIFDKFTQAKIAHQKFGVGLGLSICQQIVALHHGSIWAQNSADGGVTFFVSLPFEA